MKKVILNNGVEMPIPGFGVFQVPDHDEFELSIDDMESITTLDMKKSSFFSHRDPEIIKWMGSRKPDI